MRYLVAMTGAAGFALVTGSSLWAGRPLVASFLGGLLAALGFALLAQWWTDLMVSSYHQALEEKASQPLAPEPEPAEVLDEAPPAPDMPGIPGLETDNP